MLVVARKQLWTTTNFVVTEAADVPAPNLCNFPKPESIYFIVKMYYG